MILVPETTCDWILILYEEADRILDSNKEARKFVEDDIYFLAYADLKEDQFANVIFHYTDQ